MEKQADDRLLSMMELADATGEKYFDLVRWATRGDDNNLKLESKRKGFLRYTTRACLSQFLARREVMRSARLLEEIAI